MDHEQTVRQLVREAIESGTGPDEVCVEHPELLASVRRLWRRVRAVEDQLGALFPSGDTPAPSEDVDLSLPRIPGYEILRVLGRGGMGVVYQARQVSLNRIVAVKVPLAGGLTTPAERQRHMREARAVAALGHPNIVTVYDVGEFDGHPYFTMEFIDGQTLSAKLANTPLPAQDAASLAATIADAAHRAHHAGIIHRDLKPANILLTPEGSPKITDFGLARQSGGDATLTVTGFQFGTPNYMPPEQASGPPAAQGPSVDIYSLGAILYEMLTGRAPFRAENAVETLRQVLEEEPAPPSRLNPKTPRDLETICLTCLRKDPARRYASAEALAQDLRRFLKGEPIQARPAGAVERLYRWGRRRPAHAALLGAGLCALVAGVAIVFWVQHVQNARVAEATLREGRAREAIKTAVALATDLRGSARWVEARNVLDYAHQHVSEANSAELAEDLSQADLNLTAASELDEIRRSYPDSTNTGYNYKPASDAYKRIFTRLGIGANVSIDAGARIVRESPIRNELLTALDNAAFVARVNQHQARLDQMLAIARAADPDPWRDRFRQSSAWYDRESLLALYDAARAASNRPPTHQIVIIGALLSGLNANDKSIDILREAHKQNPADFWVNVELGNSLTRANKVLESCLYYRAAATIQPNNTSPLISLAGQLNRAGAKEESLIAIRRAVELNPRHLVAWRLYISYLRGAGRLDDAEAVWKEASERNPGPQEVLALAGMNLRWDRARGLASRGEFLKALPAYQGLASDRPSDAEFWFEYAAINLLLGDRAAYEGARDTLFTWSTPGVMRPFLVTRAFTIAPTPGETIHAAVAVSAAELLRESPNPWALTQRAAALCRSGKAAEAVPLLEQSLAADRWPGRLVLTWLWLALAHHQLGHAEEAARWRTTAAQWLDTLGGRMPDDATAQGLHLHNWLEALILRRELDAMLGSGEPAAEAAPSAPSK